VPDEHDDGHVPPSIPPPNRATDDPSTGDWLLRAIERVEETGRLAAAALARSLENVAGVRRQREEGVPVDSIVSRVLASGGPEARRATEEAFHRYQHAVMVLRALMIRTLVDDSGSSLSEVAREMNISRQKVTQLYRIGRSLSETPEGQ
jgi:uncharacterized alpha-E superfamily protein